MTVARRNGGGVRTEATMPRDNLAAHPSRCSAAREAILSLCALTRRSHRTIDSHALKIPSRTGGIDTFYTNGERRFSISR